MSTKNIFEAAVSAEMVNRINQLTPNTQPLWGKMNASKMLAHCSVTYEMIYDNKHPKPNALMRFVLKLFVKKGVVNETPYPKNSPTAPVFIIKDDKNFEVEKIRLIEYINKTLALGPNYFENKESLSFGKLTTSEWNNMLYKHLDHHLSQFGV
jgi:hypothetical protein